MIAPSSSVRCSGRQTSSKAIKANRRERSGPQRERRHSLWNGRPMRPPSRRKRHRIGHDRWRVARRLQISQRCPPSRGLAPVNRRGVPTPIGTLSYRANLRWRGHSRALLHTRYCDVSGSIERGSSPSGPIGNTANDRHGIWRDLYHSPTGAKVNTKPRVSGEAIGTHLAYIFAHGSVRSEMLLVRPHRREQHLIAVSSRATLHGIQQRKLPLPLASGTRVISNALRAADARPIIRSSCARRITWSQPPSGNFTAVIVGHSHR